MPILLEDGFPLFPFLLYGRPATVALERVILGRVETVAFAVDVQPPPIGCDAERAIADIRKLPGLYWEPDGSFLWRGDDLGGWELSGLFYEQGSQVWYGELFGRCPRERWHSLLGQLGGLPTDFSVLWVGDNRCLLPAENLPHIWFFPP